MARAKRYWFGRITRITKNLQSRFWLQVLAAAFLVSTAKAESPTELWVLQEPDEIVNYDVLTFAAKRTLKVPHRVLDHPEYLCVNAKGQMVFLPPEGVQWAGGEMAAFGDRAWIWDGRQTTEWKLESSKSQHRRAGKPDVVEISRQWFLSADGDSLFQIENTFEKMTEESGLERSMRTTARVFRTDFAGGNSETITTLSSREWCRCETGACSESCAEWSFWAPDGIVRDHFIITRFTPGQLESTYHESLLYRRLGRSWKPTRLSQPSQRPLTASDNGEILASAIPDQGCCGWENESNDQLLLLRKGEVSVVYDEVERYGNRNYDVSFYTSNARLAPGSGSIAYTINSTARPGSKPCLSSEGEENAEELARVRKAIADLPAVEVVSLGTKPESTTIIHHASLVGWLNRHEILVDHSGRLAVYEIGSGKPRETTIRVRSAADAFLR